ncbi:capsule polysaccharide export protein KpsE/RkpR [Lewinella aquimaris]|uniref:Capsule polysaccharide export protein KpsE/RkpR n=1 Tax=Neolewinella aquimaris TaxID=1835722 RepID=A0A840EDB5_9BACT|nr:Wzz/FepE/Etk N-terminal domain-containing protein [Neolewinella aquimaris]MBB4079968.1 capsule polysaccharide export protein KpsE/RkpR [Neolewinella aquimaris]
MLRTPTPPPSPPTHLLGVLRTLWQWRKPVLITTLAGAVLSVIVSLLLPTYYTGYTSFVVISPEQISIESTFGTGNNRIQFYGTGDDIDRLLSIAESNQLIDYMVDTFNLYGVYKLDSTTLKGPVRVREEFQSLYEVERNPRDIIELTIEDRNPRRAAAMATAARRHIDAINLSLIRSIHQRNASGLEQEVTDGERRLNDLNTSLAEVRRQSGVYNTEAQSEALSMSSSAIDQRLAATEARLGAFRENGRQDSIAKLTVDLAGLREGRKLLDGQLDRLNASIGQIENMEEARIKANEALTESRTRLKQYQSVLSGDRRTLEVIEEAQVPLVKSSPIRWLIVVVTTVVTFFFAVIGVLLLDSGRRYDWGSITR